MGGEDDLGEALGFLNAWAYVAKRDAVTDLPGVRQVRVFHCGMGGWVRLSFHGYTPSEALDLAYKLLLPDPEPVSATDEGVAFEGVPATPGGTAGMPARLRPRRPLPEMHAELPVPANDEDGST